MKIKITNWALYVVCANCGATLRRLCVVHVVLGSAAGDALLCPDCGSAQIADTAHPARLMLCIFDPAVRVWYKPWTWVRFALERNNDPKLARALLPVTTDGRS